MKYKLIGTDFDGTLLNKSKQVSERTKETLKKLKQEGFVLVGITGRNLSASASSVDITLFNS